MRNYRFEEEKIKIPSRMMSRLVKIRDEFDSIVETMEIMSNRKLMESLRRSRKDVKKGKIISWKELQKRWKREHGKA